METRGVKLVASIIGGNIHLPIAEVEETVYFMDRQSAYQNFITHDEYEPLFDVLLWCWERQQEVGEEARSRIFRHIDAKLGSANLDSQLPDSNETFDEPMTAEALQEAIQGRTFTSYPPTSLKSMKNKMLEQEPSNEQQDDVFAAGLKDELAEWEDVEETEEGMEEGTEEVVEEAQEVDEVSIKKPTASQGR